MGNKYRILLENVSENDNLEDLTVEGRIILK